MRHADNSGTIRADTSEFVVDIVPFLWKTRWRIDAIGFAAARRDRVRFRFARQFPYDRGWRHWWRRCRCVRSVGFGWFLVVIIRILFHLVCEFVLDRSFFGLPSLQFLFRVHPHREFDMGVSSALKYLECVAAFIGFVVSERRHPEFHEYRRRRNLRFFLAIADQFPQHDERLRSRLTEHRPAFALDSAIPFLRVFFRILFQFVEWDIQSLGRGFEFRAARDESRRFFKVRQRGVEIHNAPRSKREPNATRTLPFQ